MADYNGILIGALIALVSAIGSNFFNWKLVGEKKFKEEKRIEKEIETSNYFRNNFKYYAPFVAIFDEYYYIFGGRFFMDDSTEESQVDQFQRLVPQFLQAYKVLKDSGHLALLPPSLRGQITRFGNYLAVTAKMEPSEDGMDLDRFRRHADLMHIGGYIYEGFRRLLDVESQDKKLEELADSFWPAPV